MQCFLDKGHNFVELLPSKYKDLGPIPSTAHACNPSIGESRQNQKLNAILGYPASSRSKGQETFGCLLTDFSHSNSWF